MPSDTDNKGRVAAEAAVRPAAGVPPNVPMAGAGPVQTLTAGAAGNQGPAGGAGTAALVRADGVDEPAPEEEEGDARLNRLPMQLDVLTRVHSFRVQDLLALEKGSVVETVHEHTQDVPLRCGGALLVWAEFEVLDQQLAVRVTRLA
jgi:flagellar motor switch/type III secretory pathway protein FliN